MPRTKLPTCPHCGQRRPSGPTMITRVHNYLLGRADEKAEIRTTSHEIAGRLAAERSTVAGALRRLESEGVISWRRGKPGNSRGLIRLL